MTRSSGGGPTPCRSPGDDDEGDRYALSWLRSHRAVRDLWSRSIRPPTARPHRRHCPRGSRTTGRCPATVLATSPGPRDRRRRAAPTSPPSTVGRWCPGCSSTPRRVTPASSSSAVDTSARCSSHRSACCRWRTTRPTSPSPAERASSTSRRSSAPRPRCRWRRSRPRWAAPATGTSSTGAATTTSSRASWPGPRRAGARRSSSRSTRHTSAGVPATSTSDTCPSPAARGSPSTPPTPSSSGAWPSGSTAAERRAVPQPRPRPTAAAIGTLLSMSRNHPGRTRDNLTAKEPRAAVETFLEVFSRPSLTWDDLPRLRELTSLPIVLKGILHPDDATARHRRRHRRHLRLQPRGSTGRPVGGRARRAARRRGRGA